jgi:nucleoside-diphosphate-sugar epimerase
LWHKFRVEELFMSVGPERVLITGGSGFIGACLARDLITAGQEVYLVLRPSSNLWRLADVEGQYTAHRADLCDGPALRRIVEKCNPDVIYHLAAHGAYPFQKNRAAILTDNILGTANLLEALDGHNFRAFIQTGSSSEYGHKGGPMHEWDCLEPRTDYGVAKAAATLLCQVEAIKGRPVTTVRVFSAYGPWEEPTRLVPYVMDCCRRGINPKVTAGRQPRDFIYVDDVVDLLKTAASNPNVRGRILHAGTGRQHSVREMIETIVAVCGRGRVTANFGSEAFRPDEPISWVADINVTCSLSGWKPVCDIRSGVERMWSWFQSMAARHAA